MMALADILLNGRKGTRREPQVVVWSVMGTDVFSVEVVIYRLIPAAVEILHSSEVEFTEKIGKSLKNVPNDGGRGRF